MSTEITVRKARRNFTMADNGFINNPNLSMKAKGILLYLLSKPDGWKVIITDILAHTTDGEKAIRSGLRELQQQGYYKKIPVREDGKIRKWESYVFELPEDATEFEKKSKNV